MKKSKVAVVSLAIATAIISFQMPSFGEPLEESLVETSEIMETEVEDEAVKESQQVRGFVVLQNGLVLGVFESREVAIAEARKWANSTIEQDGNVVWRFGDHLFRVRQGSIALGSFASRQAAIAEARKWANSTIEQDGSVVWRFGDHLFRVRQGSIALGSFASREAAIAEARKWGNSTVEQDGNVVWRFGDHLYRVRQGNTVIGLYGSKAPAIAEAKKWGNSVVEKQGKVEWRFGDHLYRVRQGNTVIGLYGTRTAAVAEARKWGNSVVEKEGKVEWRFGDHLFRLRQGNTVIGTYTTRDAAVREGYKWRNSVIEQNGQVIWRFEDERVLATFTTSYNPSQTNRNHNIAVSARAINGRTVRPGEVFSFNGATGRRSIANGYREATVIVGNQFVPGLGGGVCQTSTTLYNAVLGAGLQVVERHRHSVPVSYVPVNRDATVAYGALDFKFRNNRNSNIRIEAVTTGSTITVRIYGR